MITKLTNLCRRHALTLVQMQSRAASATPVYMTQADALEATGPQVCDDMTIEVAPSVMDSAHTGHLLVSDNDGRRTGPATQAQLVAVRDSSEPADRVRLRNILGDRGPSNTRTTMTEAPARDARPPTRRLSLMNKSAPRASPPYPLNTSPQQNCPPSLFSL